MLVSPNRKVLGFLTKTSNGLELSSSNVEVFRSPSGRTHNYELRELLSELACRTCQDIECFVGF